jgi:hypothetical protein
MNIPSYQMERRQNGEGSAIIYKIREELIEILEPNTAEKLSTNANSNSEQLSTHKDYFTKTSVERVNFSLAGPQGAMSLDFGIQFDDGNDEVFPEWWQYSLYALFMILTTFLTLLCCGVKCLTKSLIRCKRKGSVWAMFRRRGK